MAYLDEFLRLRPPEKRRVVTNHWSETKQPPEPPPLSYKPLLTDKRRQNAIDTAAAVLVRFRLSHFEYEASIRHGLRAALCEAGRKWSWADFEANDIVQTALTQIGAKRPSWYQGQPEHLIPEENCKNAHCGRPLDDEDIAESRRYCSDQCRQAAVQFRYNTFRYEERLVAIQAYYHVKKQTIEPRKCALPSCGKSFRSMHDTIYCSRKCAADARGNNYESKICQNCGSEFTHRSVKNREGKYCSPKCYFAGRAAELPELTCAEITCTNTFKPNVRKQIFCSRACTKRDWGRKKKDASVFRCDPV